MGLLPHKMSLADYLVWEDSQTGRNEYWQGEVYAMMGARRGHGRIVAKLMRHLGNQLAGTPCQAFSESMKVQIGVDTVLHPDVFATCDAADLATDMIFKSPPPSSKSCRRPRRPTIAAASSRSTAASRHCANTP